MRVIEQSDLSCLVPAFSWRKAVLFGIQIAIVGALCWWLFRNERLDAIIRPLRDCPWQLSFGALVSFVAERVARPCRLAVLFRGTVPLRAAIATQSVSQVVNLLLPMRAGERPRLFAQSDRMCTGFTGSMPPWTLRLSTFRT